MPSLGVCLVTRSLRSLLPRLRSPRPVSSILSSIRFRRSPVGMEEAPDVERDDVDDDETMCDVGERDERLRRSSDNAEMSSSAEAHERGASAASSVAGGTRKDEEAPDSCDRVTAVDVPPLPGDVGDTDSRSAMEREVCEILRVSSALGALVRPITASPPRMRSLVACALTLKIDGTRTLLLVSDHRVEAIVHGETHVIVDGEFVPGRHAVSVIDCELHQTKSIYAFDMLVFDGRDVRHRTLVERLHLMSCRLPPSVTPKPYKFASSTEDAKVCALSLLEQKTDDHDGIIVLNTTDPYWLPPLKWKEHITCDFLLETAANRDGFVLLTDTHPATRGGGGGGGPGDVPGRDPQEVTSSASWDRVTASASKKGCVLVAKGKWSRREQPSARPRNVQLKANVRSKMKNWHAPSGGTWAARRNGTGTKQPYPQVYREKGEVVRVRPGAAALVRLGLDKDEDISRSDGIVVECRRGRSGWTLRNVRPDRKRPNSTRVVQQNVQLALERCTSRSWLLRSLPLQNDFHIFLRWVEACVRCCVAQEPGREDDAVVELGSSSLRHFGRGSFSTLKMYERDEKRHDVRLIRGARYRDRVSYVAGDFSGDVRCDRLLSFFTLNDYFGSYEELKDFVRAVAKAEPRSFSGLAWTADGGPVSAPGRYALRLGDKPECPQAVLGCAGAGAAPSFRFGQKLSLQLTAAEILNTYVPDMEVLKSLLGDVDYGFRSIEELPLATALNGCPASYAPLGAKLALFTFVRS